MDKPVLYGWILYSGKEVMEIIRLREEAAKAGMNLEVVDPGDVELVLDGQEPARVFRKGVSTVLPEFVIAAFIEGGDFSYNLGLLQQLETQGVLCVNRADTLKKTVDKLLTSQLLAARGVPTPRTILIRKDTSPAFIIARLGLPVVLKINDGSKGHGVVLVQSEKELQNLLEMLEAARCSVPVLAQEFIADSRGRDVRVQVVDGKPIISIMRWNHSPEAFRSNVATGGTPEEFSMTDAIRELSVRVSDILGLNLGGIDLLFKGDGFVVGEVNSMPGFVGIESFYNIDMAGEIIKGIERRIRARSEVRTTALTKDFHSLDELRGIKEPELLRFFMGSNLNLEETQHTVLMDILRRNAKTEFGKAYGFESIRAIDDFRRKIPVGDWNDYRPFAKRMERGDENILFRGRPKHFISTSGTMGQLKKIPESEEGDDVKSLVTRLRLALMEQTSPGVMESFIPLVNVASIGRTIGGIPYGYASGLALAGVSQEFRRRIAFPPDVLRAADAETLDYLIMRYALAQPLVRLLIGNNPGRMINLMDIADRHRDSLIADIEKGTLSNDLKLETELRQSLEKDLAPNAPRAQALRKMAADRGKLAPRDYWPDLKMISCWLGGTIGRYVDGLKPRLSESVVFFDCGYGASEGKLNVPMTADAPEGPLAAFGYFFEFLPLSGGEPLLAHELKDGGEYIIVITTYSGLYRYNLQDIVRVNGFTGQTPNIQFICKAGEVADLSGEKLTGAFLSGVVSQVLAARNLGWRHFCIVADSDQHRYDFYVEPEGKQIPDSQWIAEVDKAMRDQSPVYASVREQRLVEPPRLILMKKGWMDSLYAVHVHPGVTISQIKLPVICKEAPPTELIEKIVVQ